MITWLWGFVLLVAVWAAHWGSERLAKPLKKLRRQWGLTEVAGAAFIGIAAASPEIGINITSAIRGVSNIGLGVLLGSNIIALPLMLTTAYWVSRKARLGKGGDDKGGSGESSDSAENGEGQAEHDRHRQQGLLRVKRKAVTVLAIPYLVIIAVFALLTLPASWRGLQPIDGWIMFAVYLAFLAQAVFRGRQKGQNVQWTKKEIGLAVAGVVVLALSAYFTVIATKNIISAIGISEIIGGLFITSPIAALPEVFATRSVVRSGQVTSGTTSTIGDNAVTLTIALLPLALVTLPVKDFQLFWVNLAFLALMPALYASFIHWGSEEHGFKLWQVIALDIVYLVYLAVMFFLVLNVF